MAIDYSPRSVADATRFTSNTPHANAKPTNPPSSATSSASRPPQQSRMPPPGMPRPSAPETVTERVRRLRAAHLAAKKHEISRFDNIVSSSRRYFDAAHKFTVMGLIGFSGLALFVTIYATADMMIYNRKRRNEFFAIQKQLKADSLASARLAYMTGTASEDQITMVEEAEAKARESGIGLPPLLSTPKHMATAAGTEATAQPVDTVGKTVWPGEALVESSMSGAKEVEQPQKKGVAAWLFGGLKKEEVAPEESADVLEDAATAAGSSSLSRSSIARVADESQQALKGKAKAAFEQERENQRNGGPLDRVGLDEKPTSGESKKSGWW